MSPKVKKKIFVLTCFDKKFFFAGLNFFIGQAFFILMQGEIFMEKKFNLPVNVKQIGNINPDMKLKIYIEDYAYNYLKQYAKAEKYHERLAFLIGKNIKENDKDIVLISGAIKTEFLQWDQEILNFTRETWKQAYDQIEKYFSGLEIVGLMQSQPKYKNYLNENEKYVSQFKNNFNKPNQVFLLYDPIENKDIFYVLDEEGKNLKEVESYFIYYEKNDAMNEYMIENKEMKKNHGNEITEKDETPEILARRKQFERVQKTNYEQKKTVTMLTSLSIILFLICFIMGAGLIQNEDRIAKLEARLKNIDGYCKNCNERKIKSVFFEKDDFVDDKEKNDKDKKNVEQEKYKLDEGKEIEDKNKNEVEFDKTDENNLTDDEFKTDIKTKDENNIFDEKKNNFEIDKNEQDIEKIELENNFREKADEEKEINEVKNKKTEEKLRTYTVKDGDSLSLISQKFFGSTKMIDEILKLNDMDDADKIYAGKILKLPR